MSKFLINKSKSKKVKMNIDVFLYFLITLLQSFLRTNPGQEQNDQKLFEFPWSQSEALKK